MGSTKTCPACAEVIAAAAVKCPYCNTDLGGGVPFAAPPGAAFGAPAGAKPEGAGLALTLGLIGLIGGFLCGIPFLVAPFAWMYGAGYEKRCRELGVPPEGTGTAGKILGIIGTILLAVGLLFLCVALLIPLMLGGIHRSPHL